MSTHRRCRRGGLRARPGPEFGDWQCGQSLLPSLSQLGIVQRPVFFARYPGLPAGARLLSGGQLAFPVFEQFGANEGQAPAIQNRVVHQDQHVPAVICQPAQADLEQLGTVKCQLDGFHCLKFGL